MESKNNYFVDLYSVRSYNVEQISPTNVADITKKYFGISENKKKGLNEKLESKLENLEKLLQNNKNISIHNPKSEEFTFNNNLYSISLTKTNFVKENYRQAINHLNSNRIGKYINNLFSTKINKKDSQMTSILQACSYYQKQEDPQPLKIKPKGFQELKFGDKQYTVKIEKLEKDLGYAA